MEEVAMVALSGCIWLQAFVVAIETNSFTILQHLAIWGNLVAFYMINLTVSAIPSSEMYSVMFRLCKQPSYWTTMFLIVVAGMAPLLAIKHYRYTYRPNNINILQQAERLGVPILSLGSKEAQPQSVESITLSENQSTMYEPLLPDPRDSTRESQSRSSSSYPRNYKVN